MKFSGSWMCSSISIPISPRVAATTPLSKASKLLAIELVPGSESSKEAMNTVGWQAMGDLKICTVRKINYDIPKFCW